MEKLIPKRLKTVQKAQSAPPLRPTSARKEPAEAKEPPHSIEAEKGILSSMLKDQAVVGEVYREITAGHFFNPVHSEFYKLLVEMWRDEQSIDLITFTQRLIDRNLLQKLGGPAYVTEVQDYVPTSANVRFYIDIVREKFVLRQMIQTGLMLQRRAYGAQDEELAELVEEATQAIERIKRSAGSPNGAERFDFDDLMGFDSKHDPNCLVGNRYLVRGASSLWCAGSGYGKSSLAIQLAVYWACGRRCFGLRPVRPLKSLIIEAENDRGDMAEQLQGVIVGVSKLGEIDIEASRDLIRQNVGIHRAIGKTGSDFLGLLETLIEIDKPDFVWIDPLFAFSGCDLLDAEKTGYFLRNGLFPIANKRKVAINCIHHIGKPVRDAAKDDRQMAEIDYQYLGFGTSEIQNSFRAVNILVPVSNTGIFKLVFSKRGERAGAADAEGNWARSIYLQHSKEGICWLDAEKPEKATGGAAKLKYQPEHILDEMSLANGATVVELQKRLRDESGMSSATFYRLWDVLKKNGQIKPEGEGKWIKKSKIDLK